MSLKYYVIKFDPISWKMTRVEKVYIPEGPFTVKSLREKNGNFRTFSITEVPCLIGNP